MAPVAATSTISSFTANALHGVRTLDTHIEYSKFLNSALLFLAKTNNLQELAIDDTFDSTIFPFSTLSIVD